MLGGDGGLGAPVVAGFTTLTTIPILEAQGWKLASAYALRPGQLGTIIDLWELPDFNSMNVGMAAIARSRTFPAIQNTIAKETLVLADALEIPIKR